MLFQEAVNGVEKLGKQLVYSDELKAPGYEIHVEHRSMSNGRYRTVFIPTCDGHEFVSSESLEAVVIRLSGKLFPYHCCQAP